MSTPYVRTRLGQCDSIEPAVVSSAVPIAFAAFIVAAGALYLPIAVSGRQSLLSPVGVSVVVGAFLFGVGMQLGGGCASGTLYTAGGGNTRMVITLLAFIAGSVVGVAQMPWWEKLPATKPLSL